MFDSNRPLAKQLDQIDWTKTNTELGKQYGHNSRYFGKLRHQLETEKKIPIYLNCHRNGSRHGAPATYIKKFNPKNLPFPGIRDFRDVMTENWDSTDADQAKGRVKAREDI